MPAIKLLLTEQEVEAIAKLSGSVPRERWIKDLLAAAVDAAQQFEEGPCWLRIKATPRTGEQPEGVHHFVPIED